MKEVKWYPKHIYSKWEDVTKENMRIYDLNVRGKESFDEVLKRIRARINKNEQQAKGE